MSDPTDPDRDDAALAAEFALHLLEPGERAAFEERLAVEPHLQALVRQWDADFAGLAAEVPPVAPPRRLKKAIDKRLHGPGIGPDGTPLWMRWRVGIGAALLALLVGLAVLFGDVLAPVPDGPVYRAELAAEDRALVVLASLDAATGVLAVDHVQGAPPPGRVLELWLIAEGAAAPVSLGVFADEGATRLTVPAALRPQFEGGTLAVSDEPPGGSPTGTPTGSVLATGAVTRL